MPFHGAVQAEPAPANALYGIRPVRIGMILVVALPLGQANCFVNGALLWLAVVICVITGLLLPVKRSIPTVILAGALLGLVRPNDAGREIGQYVPLEILLRSSDVIALHCPLFPATLGIINWASIAKMKDGVILLNNARGPPIVEQDLADALNSGKAYAAGLDVVSEEPIRADNSLLSAKNCLITPSISWVPKESRRRLMDVAVENLRAFLAGTPVNVVKGP